MTKRVKSFYIGWRSNPQLRKGGYYKAYGQLSKAEAKQKERDVAYGSITLTEYENYSEYMKALERYYEQGYGIYYN